MTYSKGFTLIEIMVAVSIFVVVALIATGAFITANQINQKAQAIKLIMDNLNFALDSMSLKIRKGTVFDCRQNTAYDPVSDLDSPIFAGQNCDISGGGGQFLAFMSKKYDRDKNNYFAYKLENQKLMYKAGYELNSGPNSFSGASYTPITMNEAVIDDLHFYVFNTGMTARPRVVISLRGHTKVGGQNTDFALETVASER